MATRDLSLERERKGILRILNKGLSRVTAVLQAERTEGQNRMDRELQEGYIRIKWNDSLSDVLDYILRQVLELIYNLEVNSELLH